MILTVDNLDGQGAQDYTSAIDRSEAFTITRKLNAPSTLKAVLCLAASTLPVPARRARVIATNDAGITLFTGYVTLEPTAVYAGENTVGPVYRLHLHAISDDWLLDTSAGEQASPGGLGQLSPVLLQTLTQAAGAGVFMTSALSAGRALGVYSGAGAASWSTHAGSIAAAGYGAYRVLNGALTLAEMPGAVHTLTQDFTPARLQLASTREMVNDITLTAEPEPTTTWTELFRGDGTTSAFTLTGAPQTLAADHAADHSTLLADDFTGSTLSHSNWQISDSGSHLSLGANGLVMNGGNGLDGQTTLTAAQALELGGSVVIELQSVMLNPASAGVLCGLYAGSTRLANCVAGCDVQQSAGETLLVPIVQAGLQSNSFAVQQGHRYTLRLRLFSTERLRFNQTYYTRAAGVVRSFGGGLIDADVRVVMEIRDLGDSSNTPVTVLYDGVIAGAPAQASVVVLNSIQLFGSIGSVSISRAGSLLVRSTEATTGTPRTRLIGQPSQGLDCALTTGQNSTVTFFDGRIPAAQELVTVQYQQYQPTAARLADPVSIAAEAGSGGPGTARLHAAIHSPLTRSSVDCENAAAALLAISTDRAAALSGSYTFSTPPDSDLLPGDLLNLPGSPSLLIRAVTITDAGAGPEALTYAVACSNDWAAPVSIGLAKIADNVAAANLPATALNLVPGAQPGDPATVPEHVLANLRQMSVTSLSNSVLTLDAGAVPPAGGGFEVRRRDSGWGQTSADLVLQSPVRGFDIPRLAFEEHFFVRMHDASTPRLYSRFATAFVTHAAVG